MFSGIGGFEYGIERAFDNSEITRLARESELEDIPQVQSDNPQQHGRQLPTCIGYSEIDKYAIKVYERNFNENQDCGQPISQRTRSREHIRPIGDKPNNQVQRTKTEQKEYMSKDNNRRTKNYGNATTINATELPDFDLLVGGFPCQAFSIAGKRAGFDDTRGTLFFDIARILKEKQPRNLVLENVKGLLSHDGGRTFTTIIGVLADLGYFVEWQVLNSKDFGVPQNRERVFIVGHLGGQPRRKVFPIGQSGKTPVEYRGQGAGVFSNALDSSYYKGHDGKRQLIAEPRIRRLTPLECERLQGFPDNWTKEGVELCQGKLCAAGKVDACLGHFVEISDTQRYKMCGNAVTTNVVQAVMTNLRRAM
jgi:site-specific DNA-cytosine methylase